MPEPIELVGGPMDGSSIMATTDEVPEGFFIGVVLKPVFIVENAPRAYDPTALATYRVNEHGKAVYQETEWDGTYPEDEE